MTLSHALYNLLVGLAQPLLRRKLARRARAEPGYAVAVPERFGHYSHAPETSPELLWVHAVSLGETRAAGILIPLLRQAMPGVRILLTHTTATGRAEGAKLLREGDVQVWLPWDTPTAVQAFLTHFRPQMGLLMETEVWPNLVHRCRAAGVPLVLVNARMSEKSLRSALRWASLMRPAYSALSAAWAQTIADAQRLRRLGAAVAAVTGNLKFDAQADARQCAKALHWREKQSRPVVLLASSREGEEALWLRAIQSQAKTLAPVQWLIVPRHPQRVDAVERLLQEAGLSVLRRSHWQDEGPPNEASTVWLGDSLGEMALYYSLASVALLGGSFEPLGGQNLIEAAACACPVVMGPHTFNFLEAAEHAQSSEAALRVSDMAVGVAQAVTLATDQATQQRMARAARVFAQSHQGAGARVVSLVLPMLVTRSRPTPVRAPTVG